MSLRFFSSNQISVYLVRNLADQFGVFNGNVQLFADNVQKGLRVKQERDFNHKRCFRIGGRGQIIHAVQRVEQVPAAVHEPDDLLVIRQLSKQTTQV